MTFKSSNSEWIEKLSNEDLIRNIRNAMKELCIRPVHVFDQVYELIDRFCEYQDIKEIPEDA